MTAQREAILTVVIPVFNGEKYLRQSLQSVSKQVCTYNFDVLILNDGSSDGSLKIAQEFESLFNNFRVIDLPKSGLVGVLNHALEVVDTKYISRHDADDVMVQGRMEVQIQQILDNPELNCIGGQIIAFSEEQGTEDLKVNMYPADNREIKSQLMKKNVFASPTVTYCRNCAQVLGGYRRMCDGAEDYDLWLRMAKRGAMSNDLRILTRYRIHPEQVTQSRKLKVYRATFLAKIFFLFGFGFGLLKFQVPSANCHLLADCPSRRKLSVMYFLALDFFRFLRVIFTNRKV